MTSASSAVDEKGGNGSFGKLVDRQIEKVPVQFGVQDAVAPLAPGAADQQLVVIDVHRDVFGDVLQGLGPAQHQGLPLGLAHGLGEIFAPLDVDLGASGSGPGREF